MFEYMNALMLRFKRDQDGIALTEYLILLGLLTAAVIAAVLLFGEQLGIQWGTWGTWMSGANLGAPT
ncbi:Flp family type IVb pilin [Aliiroseovarius subalbicans]|uniref:Flp family type IVb pilin n=1 Tax=Aliiroseovarius subalbicans TaxID=2925840 RepID=UPI001F57FAD0|nr:Flp family type IVb pilin [Aliiroseovarius subalbicans]MCI2400416.1 Flp family type IVb pilin [Aliiroseovarius subalbicans]